jgi:hypothetical protein
MYLEFRLPLGAGGQSAANALYYVRRDLTAWSEKYHIDYKEKLVKYTLRVFFEDPEIYTFFGLTWNPKYSRWASSIDYRLVEPMSPPKSN